MQHREADRRRDAASNQDTPPGFHLVAACEKTKTDTALSSSGLSLSSNAGMTPRRPLMIDSRIEARSEPQRYELLRVRFVDPNVSMPVPPLSWQSKQLPLVLSWNSTSPRVALARSAC